MPPEHLLLGQRCCAKLHAGVQHGFSSMHGISRKVVNILEMRLQEAAVGQCEALHIAVAVESDGGLLMDSVQVANVGKLFAAGMRHSSLRRLCTRSVGLDAEGAGAGS